MTTSSIDEAVTTILGAEAGSIGIVARPVKPQYLISASDIVPKRQVIERFRKLAGTGRVREALVLAEQNLVGERRNEKLRSLAMNMSVHAELGPRAIADMEERLPTLQMPVVQAALYLVATHTLKHAPRLDIVSPLIWTAAIRWLFDYLPPDMLRAITGAILAEHPDQRFLARLNIAASLVPERIEKDRFSDRFDASVQFAPSRAERPTGLLVCFCGFHGRMGIPLNFLHRWVSRAELHALYLRDPSQAYFKDGLPIFGESHEDMTSAIRLLAERLGVPRIATYGSSMGGLVAITTGLEIGAHRVISAAGTADIRPPDGVERLTPDEQVEVTRREAAALAELLRADRSGMETAYLYGEQHERDSVVAEALRGIDGVEAIMLDDLNRHNIDFHLVMTGRYDRAFAWLAGELDRLSFSD